MEEEDRLVRVYVRHLKKLQGRSETVKIDNVIIRLVSKRVFLTKAKLIASLFAVLPYPVPGKTIQQRINRLMQSKTIERDLNFPEFYSSPCDGETLSSKTGKGERRTAKVTRRVPCGCEK